MKLLYFFIFFLILSCSKKEESYKEIEQFMKNGTSINIFNEKKTTKEVFKIRSVSYQSKLQSDFFNKFKFYFNKSIKSSDFLILKNNDLVVIDKKSNLLLLDKNFKKKFSIKLNKKRDQKDYQLIYKLETDNKKIFVSDNLGNIYAVNSENLKIIWKKNLSVPFSSDIKIYRDNIYLINSNSKIFSINKNNGRINWSYETPSKLIKSRDSYRIEIIRDNLIFSNDFGELYNLDLKIKNITWSYNLEDKNFKNQNKTFKISNFLVDGSKVYFSSNFGEFFGIDTKNGSILWRQEIFNHNKIFIKNNNLFFVNDENYFIILNKFDGRILLKKNLNTLFDRADKKFNFLNIVFDKKYINIILDNKIIKINSKNLNDISVNKKKLNIFKYYIKGSNIFVSTENKLLKL
jgi:outer membrane protein assembly factor BamB